MTPAIQAKVKEYVDKYIATIGNVIEVGSHNVNGGVRHLFEKADDYVGIDMDRGPGVDIIMNSHVVDRKFGYKPNVIVCLEMLEHDNAPWLTVQAMRNLLAPEGYLIISTPMNGFPEHRYPKDYFRYMRDAYTDWFFDGFSILDLSNLNWEGYGTICGIAQKPSTIGYDTKIDTGCGDKYCW